MNKIKHLAFAVSGALLVTVGLISCDSDEVNTNEEISTELKGKGPSNNYAYQDFRLGQVSLDGGDQIYFWRLDSGSNQIGCINFPADCFPFDIVITVPRKGEVYRNLSLNISNYRSIFTANQDLLLEDIHPTLVNGVVDDFFKVEVDTNSETGTSFFRFKRKSDNVLVGTYPIVINY